MGDKGREVRRVLEAVNVNLVFLGDSLTEYFDWQRHFPEHKVLNLGISGEPVEGLLSRLGRVRSSVSDPDFIFVMTGINNIAMEDYDILGTYEIILREMSSWSQKTKIVVQSILPVLLPWVENASIEETNASIRNLSDELHLEYLDIYSSLSQCEATELGRCLMEDGVHLSDEGYKAWAGKIQDFLFTQAL